MRLRPVVLLPLLSLAACSGGGAVDNGQPGSESWARNLIGNQGSPGFRSPDGSFDRADYRRVMVPGCAAGMHDGNPTIPAAEVNRFCTCWVDGVLAGSSDAEMFAMQRDNALQERKQEEAARVCMPPSARGRAPLSPDDEPPPPEEPAPLPPGQQSGTPPPVVQDPPPPPRR